MRSYRATIFSVADSGRQEQRGPMLSITDEYNPTRIVKLRDSLNVWNKSLGKGLLGKKLCPIATVSEKTIALVS
jgi:hypothetical protein